MSLASILLLCIMMGGPYQQKKKKKMNKKRLQLFQSAWLIRRPAHHLSWRPCPDAAATSTHGQQQALKSECSGAPQGFGGLGPKT